MASKERSYGGIAVTERREQRRRRFIDAGIALFGSKGYHDASVSAICAEAGLARAHFYEQFTDREDLLIAAYDRIQVDSREAVREAVRAHEGTDVAERARIALSAYAHSVGDDPRRAQVSFIEIVGVSAKVEEHRRQRRKQWRDFLQSEIKRYMGDDFEPVGGWAAATTGLVGALMALVEQWASSPRARQRRLEELVDVLTVFLLSLMR